MEHHEVSAVGTDKVIEFGKKRVSTFLQKHYVVSSLYLVGLIMAAFGNGYTVDPKSASVYHERMTHAGEVTSADMLHLSRELRQAQDLYYQHKGWFTCDLECIKYRDHMNLLQQELGIVKLQRDNLMLQARSDVGPWSVYGIADLRKAFWEAWAHGKEAARRMTMFDAVFIGLGAMTGSNNERESSLITTLFQILIQFVMNLTVGLLTSLFVFLFDAWSIIQLYGPSLVSGLALFMLVCCAASSLVITAIGGIFGALGGGIYLTIRSAEKRARLEAQRVGVSEHLHWE